jgi:hypothetical protein
MAKKNNTYECAACHKVFKLGWTHEEALEEFNRDFPKVPIEETDIICDICYKKMTKYFKKYPERKPPMT